MASRTRLKNLHRSNPHCHWCGVLTSLTAKLHARNRATLDHLFPRHDWRRHANVEGRQRVVLACYPCNHGRGSQAFIEGMEKPCAPPEDPIIRVFDFEKPFPAEESPYNPPMPQMPNILKLKRQHEQVE